MVYMYLHVIDFYRKNVDNYTIERIQRLGSRNSRVQVALFHDDLGRMPRRVHGSRRGWRLNTCNSWGW